MPRTARVIPGGMVFPGLNRGVGRPRRFTNPVDNRASEESFAELPEKRPIRICVDRLIPNHWRVVL